MIYTYDDMYMYTYVYIYIYVYVKDLGLHIVSNCHSFPYPALRALTYPKTLSYLCF